MAALAAARPQALAALLRYFRDLDTAEDALQEATVRALGHWPSAGLPRDPAAWLIVAGRNAALDELGKRARFAPLPPDEALADQLSDGGAAAADLPEQLDSAPYRDDLLRLLFICCHPGLNAADQIALALRIVSNLTVDEIARAFLVTPAAMEQRITRAKKRIADANVPFDTPGASERAARLDAVATMIYLLFNEGYSASGGEHVRAALCEEALRLARLLRQLFPDQAEVMGLHALLLLQHARRAARLDAQGELVALEDQDRSLWDQALTAEGVALVGAALRGKPLGPLQVQAAIAAVHAQAARSGVTDWAEIDRLYAALEALQPSPVVTLNRAVACEKVRGPAAALAMIEPLSGALAGYLHYHALHASLLASLQRRGEARAAFGAALALARTGAERAHLRRRLDDFEKASPCSIPS